MVRKIIMAALFAAAASCGLQETGDNLKDRNEDVWTGPGAGIVDDESEGPRKTIWYMTGFDYPDGYNWKSDPESGEVRCSLVVFANGVPMMKVPVGHEYEVSSDPDMHRIIDGDLYTDYSTDSVTVIRKNGKPLFRYSGREMMIGMHVDGDDVYTLGQSRDGKGFSYRKNGELLMERRNGALFNTFFETGRGCAFAFYEPVESESEDMERYFICVDGIVSQIAVRDDVLKVWDVLLKDGRQYYIAGLVGIGQPVLVSDDAIQTLELPKQTVMKTCRFIPSASEVVVDGVTRHKQTKTMTGGLWYGGDGVTMFPAGYRSVYSCTWENGVYCVLEGYSSGDKQILRAGDMHMVPDGYTVMGSHPMAMVDGILHVGLTAMDGTEPKVWKDGELYPVKINGYISSISVY